jgi:hypothetical protein
MIVAEGSQNLMVWDRGTGYLQGTVPTTGSYCQLNLESAL